MHNNINVLFLIDWVCNSFCCTRLYNIAKQI